MAFVRKLLWLTVFGASTFFFVVVFENGCCDRERLLDGAQQQMDELLSFFRSGGDAVN